RSARPIRLRPDRCMSTTLNRNSSAGEAASAPTAHLLSRIIRGRRPPKSHELHADGTFRAEQGSRDARRVCLGYRNRASQRRACPTIIKSRVKWRSSLVFFASLPAANIKHHDKAMCCGPAIHMIGLVNEGVAQLTTVFK